MTIYSDRINGTEASVAIKAPCAIATLANITLSGLQTIDGVAIAAGVRVLVRAQTDARQNGIWVSSTSAWSRATDFNGARDVVQGTSVYVWGGNSFATGQFVLTTANPVIGVSDLTFIYGWVQSNPPVLRGDWAAGTSYLINNAVFDPITGASYYAKTNHTSGSTFAGDIALWQKYAARGAPGAVTDLSDFARTLLDDADAAAAQATLGLGAMATKANVTTAEIAAATLVTAAEGIRSNNNDTTIPTSAAVKGLVDTTAIGVGQTYQNMTASRALSTSYQNTTGRPIAINAFSTNQTTYAFTVDVSTDGSTWQTIFTRPSTAFIAGTSLSEKLIIPNGIYYRIQLVSGTAPAFTWMELR